MMSTSILVSLHLLLLLSFSETSPALSQTTTVVTSLPGFPGQLPFYLETGYIGVGEIEEVELFYYFIESSRSPKDDALLLWLTGGPGCSALSALFYEIGPITFDYDKSSGNRPVLRLNPYSWTNVANIIFLDQPVGTGFSYSKTTEGYTVDDFSSAQQSYDFLRKWLLAHPKFSSNPLYISGDSYSGKIAPMITLKIAKGNEEGLEPMMNLQGYSLGNPVTNEHDDINARVRFAYLMALISDELYHSAASNCNGEYINVDVNNSACRDDLLTVTECITKLDIAHILEPSCDYLSPTPPSLLLGSKWKKNVNLNHLLLLQQPQFRVPGQQQWCRTYNYLYSYIWANDKEVQKALHVKQGTVSEWLRCNLTLQDDYYIRDLLSSVPYHIELIKRGYRMLIYSGDHDMAIPHVGTYGWISKLNLTISNDWAPWFVEGQIAGFTTVYESGRSLLTYATVKGAGHTAPEYKPRQCLAMIERWLAHTSL